jgi:uncharacterized glyoxalase superfamily protein PhnB
MAKKKKAARKAPRKPARKPVKKAVRKPVRKAVRPVLVTRHEPETLRLRSASPSFTVGDIEKSLAWYRDVLGFVVRERWERDGKLAGVEVVAGAVSFLLGQDDWKKGRDRIKGQGLNIYCSTAQNVDDLAARIKAAGANLVQEPKDQPWGTRDLAVLDPDGFKLTIGVELKG